MNLRLRTRDVKFSAHVWRLSWNGITCFCTLATNMCVFVYTFVCCNYPRQTSSILLSNERVQMHTQVQKKIGFIGNSHCPHIMFALLRQSFNKIFQVSAIHKMQFCKEGKKRKIIMSTSHMDHYSVFGEYFCWRHCNGHVKTRKQKKNKNNEYLSKIGIKKFTSLSYCTSHRTCINEWCW